jgi:hypothetical protein
MSRITTSACGPLAVRSPQQTALDYGWWASNGPTAGYLARLALDAVDPTASGVCPVRHLNLHVLRLAAAAPIDIAISSEHGADGFDLATVTFGQRGPFAVASLMIDAAHEMVSTGDAKPPAALPLEAYRPMVTPSPTLAPVTARFVYRPTVEPDGSGPRAGWDVVWVTPTDPRLRGRALVASIIDSWYPPSFMRAVREQLRGRERLHQPPPTTLAGASLSFTASRATYDAVHHALLANQISTITDGYYFERAEVWSDRGELLATAELLRRSHDDREKS